MMLLTTIRDHTFFPIDFGPKSVIIDAGANVGDFSRECANKFGCTPYAIEPNPDSAGKITDARVFNHAIGAKTRTTEFFIGEVSEGCSLLRHQDHTTSRVVQVVALQEFLAEQALESVDLLKVDIEGAELEFLGAMTAQVNIAQISVEFHDFVFPEQHDQVLQVIRHMKSVGF
jgi:FkbM family methyltransferase